MKREVSQTVGQPEAMFEQTEAVSETVVTENVAEVADLVSVADSAASIEPTDTIALSDSTIRINYVCGIPFIIDDSAPMLLPPIDKNPVGYVSSDGYTKKEGGLGTNRYGDKISACGKTNPVDSLLWLNKLINDIPQFLDSALMEVSHHYTYKVTLWSLNCSSCIYMIYIIQFPDWSCIADNTPRYQRKISYFIDGDGNLFGQLYVEQPIEWINHVEHKPNYLQIISFDSTYFMLSKKAKRSDLIRINLTKYEKKSEYYVE